MRFILVFTTKKVEIFEDYERKYYTISKNWLKFLIFKHRRAYKKMKRDLYIHIINMNYNLCIKNIYIYIYLQSFDDLRKEIYFFF